MIRVLKGVGKKIRVKKISLLLPRNGFYRIDSRLKNMYFGLSYFVFFSTLVFCVFGRQSKREPNTPTTITFNRSENGQEGVVLNTLFMYLWEGGGTV